MLNSILIVGCLGLFFGIFLTFIYTKFKIDENPLYSKVYELLPKGNCGACGYAGCSAFAEVLIENKVTPEKCVMIGEKELSEICKLLGIEKIQKEKFVARICCYGGTNAKKKFEYTTIKTCNVINSIFDISVGPSLLILPYNIIFRSSPIFMSLISALLAISEPLSE